MPDLGRAEQPWCWLLSQLGVALDRALGMLCSHLRPGLNHMAFTVESVDLLGTVLAGAPAMGWTQLPVGGHLIAGGANVARTSAAVRSPISLRTRMTIRRARADVWFPPAMRGTRVSGAAHPHAA